MAVHFRTGSQLNFPGLRATLAYGRTCSVITKRYLRRPSAYKVCFDEKAMIRIDHVPINGDRGIEQSALKSSVRGRSKVIGKRITQRPAEPCVDVQNTG